MWVCQRESRACSSKARGVHEQLCGGNGKAEEVQKKGGKRGMWRVWEGVQP